MEKCQAGFEASWNRSFNPNRNFEATRIVNAFLKGVKLRFCNISHAGPLVAIPFMA